MGISKSKETKKGKTSQTKIETDTPPTLKEMAAKGLTFIIEDTNDLGVCLLYGPS